MQKAGIVVLNYKNYKDTIQCVDSVLQQKDVDISVVIVDNGSNNESYSTLEKKYKYISQVCIISTDTNVGYARGNNIGIKYLRKKKIDYIFIANSDLVFTSDSILISLLVSDENSVGLLVPLIKNVDGTIEQRVAYKKKFFYLRIMKAILKVQIASFYINERVHDKDIKSLNIANEYKNKSGLQNDCYIISGSGYLLTPSFFKYYDQLFPETFLYFEEWATMIYLHKAGLTVKVVNTDIIIHKGASSTPMDMKAKTMKKRKLAADSARKVIKLIWYSCNYIRKKYSVSYERRTDA